MRLKLRAPSGTPVLTLADSATVSDLLKEISSSTSIPISSLDLKIGFPPKPLPLSTYSAETLLTDLPVKLAGEQIIVTSGGGTGTSSGGGRVQSSSSSSSMSKPPAPTTRPPAQAAPPSSASFSFTGGPSSGTRSNTSTPNPPLSLKRKAPPLNKDDPPVIPLRSGRGSMVLRVMEDDNSCLFRAISYVLTRSVMSVEELRQLVAGTIQEQPDMYNEVVLEQKPDAYCEWIKMENSWGGGIELGILAGFFDTEIIALDVASNSILRFNENPSSKRMVIVVYSGIHYDAIALAPAGNSIMNSEDDEVVFNCNDEEILTGAKELCAKLKQKKYFTDTKSFSLKCNICQKGLIGEKGAVEHATQTGHADFGEY